MRKQWRFFRKGVSRVRRDILAVWSQGSIGLGPIVQDGWKEIFKGGLEIGAVEGDSRFKLARSGDRESENATSSKHRKTLPAGP
jgi:hypothetical protein